MKALKIIGIIVAVALAIDYWQWVLVVALIAGLGYSGYRLTTWARTYHARQLLARQAHIADMERDLGIN